MKWYPAHAFVIDSLLSPEDAAAALEKRLAEPQFFRPAALTPPVTAKAFFEGSVDSDGFHLKRASPNSRQATPWLTGAIEQSATGSRISVRVDNDILSSLVLAVIAAAALTFVIYSLLQARFIDAALSLAISGALYAAIVAAFTDEALLQEHMLRAIFQIDPDPADGA